MEAENGEDIYAAIQGNGQAKYAGTVVNIYEGAVVSNDRTAAIYHPQEAS